MNPRMRSVLIVARGAALEMRRRSDLAVLAFVAVLLLGFLAVARSVGFDDPATGTLVLNLALTVAVGLGQLMALVTTARQMPDEFEHRTLYPLLARPLHRRDLLLGKWLAGALTGLGVVAVLGIPAWLLVPRLEPYHAGTLLQLAVLQPGAVAVVAAGGLLATLLLPRLPALFAAGALLFGAGHLVRAARGWWPLHALPDPGRLTLVLRYTDGAGPLQASEFTLLLAYAVLWTVLLLGAAVFCFDRRSLSL